MPQTPFGLAIKLISLFFSGILLIKTVDLFLEQKFFKSWTISENWYWLIFFLFKNPHSKKFAERYFVLVNIFWNYFATSELTYIPTPISPITGSSKIFLWVLIMRDICFVEFFDGR